jgi:hypothetical protein
MCQPPTPTRLPATRRRWVGLAAAALAGACSGCVVVGAVGGFAQWELLRALLDRLAGESSEALRQLGLPGGFANDPQVRLVVPPGVRGVRLLLVAMGLGPAVEAMERQLNRAAEQVAAAAQPVVLAVLPLLPWQRELDAIYRGETGAVDALRRLATAELRERLLPLAAAAAERTGLDRTWAEVQDAIRPIADARNAADAARRESEAAARDALRAAEPPEVRAARRRLDEIRQSADQAAQLDLGEARRWLADQVVDALFVKLHQAFAADAFDGPAGRAPAPVEDALRRTGGL